MQGKQKEVGATMTYVAKEFEFPATLTGLSDTQLEGHLEYYRKHIAQLNQVRTSVAGMIKRGQVETPNYSNLQHHLASGADQVRLHELYFKNLGGDGQLPKGTTLAALLSEHFGSFEAWRKDFQTTANMPGLGWAILYRDNVSGNLNNLWLDEHQGLSDIDGRPLLVMDAWEHAYKDDYGFNRYEYVDAFFRNINWHEVASRL